VRWNFTWYPVIEIEEGSDLSWWPELLFRREFRLNGGGTVLGIGYVFFRLHGSREDFTCFLFLFYWDANNFSTFESLVLLKRTNMNEIGIYLNSHSFSLEIKRESFYGKY